MASRFRFRNLPRFLTGALGDMWYRAANGNLTAVAGTPEEGDVPTRQADGTVAWAAGGGFVPTYIAPGETFTVPANRQALFVIPIVTDGTLTVDGVLIEVD